jgi:hypothetical protein
MSQSPLYDEMERLERQVDLARGVPGRVEAERRALVAKHARARAALESFYARGVDDVQTEKALKAANSKAHREASDSWDEKLQGVRMQEGLAREQLHAFIRSNFAELAAELVGPSREAGERFVKVRAELVEALQAKQVVLDRWRPILGAGSIEVGDLPAADDPDPPMPRSLSGLVRRAEEAATA